MFGKKTSLSVLCDITAKSKPNKIKLIENNFECSHYYTGKFYHKISETD